MYIWLSLLNIFPLLLMEYMSLTSVIMIVVIVLGDVVIESMTMGRNKGIVIIQDITKIQCEGEQREEGKKEECKKKEGIERVRVVDKNKERVRINDVKGREIQIEDFDGRMIVMIREYPKPHGYFQVRGEEKGRG